MDREEEILRVAVNMQWTYQELDVYKKMVLPAMRELSRERSIGVLDFIATFEIKDEDGVPVDKIILCDGDYYWESDTEGDHPMGGKELFEIYERESLNK